MKEEVSLCESLVSLLEQGKPGIFNAIASYIASWEALYAVLSNPHIITVVIKTAEMSVGIWDSVLQSFLKQNFDRCQWGFN